MSSFQTSFETGLITPIPTYAQEVVCISTPRTCLHITNNFFYFPLQHGQRYQLLQLLTLWPTQLKMFRSQLSQFALKNQTPTDGAQHWKFWIISRGVAQTKGKFNDFKSRILNFQIFLPSLCLNFHLNHYKNLSCVNYVGTMGLPNFLIFKVFFQNLKYKNT